MKTLILNTIAVALFTASSGTVFAQGRNSAGPDCSRFPGDFVATARSRLQFLGGVPAQPHVHAGAEA